MLAKNDEICKINTNIVEITTISDAIINQFVALFSRWIKNKLHLMDGE